MFAEVKTTKRRFPDRDDEIVQCEKIGKYSPIRGTNWRSCYFFSVSQPKVRRVEKIVQNTKSTKEDVMKSQVYLQFIRNMDNELRRFEETEQPSTIGGFEFTVHFFGGIYCLGRHPVCSIQKIMFFFQTTLITTVTASHRKC